jgi:subtilisin
MTSIRAHKMAPAAAATPLFAYLVGLLLLLAPGSPGAAQESGRTVPSDLLRKAWDEGKVRVIVEVGGAGAVPEGQLLSHAAVTRQRGRIGSDQLALRSALRGLRHRVLREFKTIPYVGLEVDYDALRVLDSLPGLATRVHEDILLRPLLAQSAPLIKAPAAWNAGWNGSGQLIAIIDSGVDKNHPFLAGRVVAEACFDSSGVSTCPNGLPSDTSPGAGVPCTFAPDCFHGTLVAGIAAGNGPSFDGIARGANVMAVRTAHSDVCDGSPCTSHFFSDMVAGLERIYDLRNTYNFAAVDVSLGLPGVPFFSPCDSHMSAMTNIIANLRSAGIATVIASGNDAEQSSDFFFALSFPACISSAISVGSTKDGSGPGGTPADEVSLFSNSASFLSLLAPGEWITSSVPGGGFDTFRGTSLAAPHVAGAWAIAKQANPGASVSDLLAGLQNTGKPILDPGNDLVFSRVAATALQFSASTYSVAEAVGTATITVTRSGSMFGPNFAPLTVDYATSPGTAIPGHDYTDTSGTLVFNVGDISKTFTVQIVPDSRDDRSRTVNLALSNAGGGALLGMRDAAVLTIGDDDVGGSIQFAARSFSVSEQAGTATITVKRSGGSAGDVTIQYATSDGTAHDPADYHGVTGTITFESSGPGATTQKFSVPIVGNGLPDGNRTVNLTLHTPSGGAALGAQKTAVLTIVDDEVVLQFSQATYSVTEGRSATITVTRTGPPGPPVNVMYALLPGSATQGTDYGGPFTGVLSFLANQTSRTFTIPTVNDTLAEGPETVLLQLSSPTGAMLGARQTAVLMIVDNDPAGIVKFSATGFTTPDADGDAIITVTRSGGSGAGATVKFATGGGTAMPGTHYDPISPTTLEFLGNAATATFKVKIHGNTTAGDGNKTVELLLSQPGGGATLGRPRKATLTIVNNDFGGALSFLNSSVSVSESSPTATITVRRTGGIAGGVTVDVLATNGTAKLGIDYGAPTPATLVFDPGDTQKTFVVPILSNPSAVASRSLTLKLQNAVGGGKLGLPGTATLTITKAGMRFSRTAYAVNAGSAAIITIMRAGRAPGAAVTYATEDGNDADPAKNAHAGTDYQAIPQTQLSPAFGSGQTSRTFAVRTLNSGVHGNRTLLLHLSDASKDELGQPATATLTIFGTAQPELQLTAFTPPELAILGKNFAVPNTVRNFSGAAAGASTLQFFLSTDSTWDPGDIILGERAVPALAAGAKSSATTMLTVPANAGVPSGSYQILAVVDAHAQVAEQDETNNVLAQLLTVASNFVGVTAHDGGDDTPGADTVTGIDYEVLTPSPLSFGPSVSSQTVEIALLPRADAQGPRAFRVTLHDANSQAVLGSPSTVRLDPRPAGLRRFAAGPRGRRRSVRPSQHLRQRYR